MPQYSYSLSRLMTEEEIAEYLGVNAWSLAQLGYYPKVAASRGKPRSAFPSAAPERFPSVGYAWRSESETCIRQRCRSCRGRAGS